MIANEDSMDIAEMMDVEMRKGEQHATRNSPANERTRVGTHAMPYRRTLLKCAVRQAPPLRLLEYQFGRGGLVDFIFGINQAQHAAANALNCRY